jgi:subtilisin-like proprotein convertase family protein
VIGALSLGAAPAVANDLVVNVWMQNGQNLVVDNSAMAWTDASKGVVQGAGVILISDYGTETPVGIKATLTTSTAYGLTTTDIYLADNLVNSIDVIANSDGSFEYFSLDTLSVPGAGPGDGPPANDLCANAIAIGLGTTNGSTLGATLDSVGTCGTTNTAPGVWYTVQGTGAAMQATTCSATVQYDTKISVFTGACAGLVCVGGNDDSCIGGSSGLLSTVNWASTAGTTYRVLVHGFSASVGNFELTINSETPPVETGACCFSDGSCLILSADDCAAGSGVYQGDDTSCFSAGNATNYAGAGGAIPDAGLGTFSNTLAVGDFGPVGDVDVNLQITHTWVGDLQVDLTHGATTVRVVDRPGEPVIGAFGCSTDNFAAVTLDDEAGGGAIENQCAANLAGDFTPNNPLSAFDGAEKNGNWTLTVTDLGGGDTGSVNSWSIDIGGAGDPLCPEPECFLVVGEGEGNDPYVGGTHVFTTQVNGIEAGFFTLMEDLPEFVLPAAPARNGNNLTQVMGQGTPNNVNADVPAWMLDGSFSIQILMWNPTVFPGLPEQYTTGLHVQITPQGRILAQPFGGSQGQMSLGYETLTNAEGQRVIRFPFVVGGL